MNTITTPADRAADAYRHAYPEFAEEVLIVLRGPRRKMVVCRAIGQTAQNSGVSQAGPWLKVMPDGSYQKGILWGGDVWDPQGEWVIWGGESWIPVNRDE